MGLKEIYEEYGDPTVLRDHDIQKTVTLDKETVKIIDSMPGSCFSEKLRFLALAYDILSNK